MDRIMETASQKVPLKIWILVFALVLGAIVLTHPAAALDLLQTSDIPVAGDQPVIPFPAFETSRVFQRL